MTLADSRSTQRSGVQLCDIGHYDTATHSRDELQTFIKTSLTILSVKTPNYQPSVNNETFVFWTKVVINNTKGIT